MLFRLLIVSALLLAPVPALAWSAPGHQMIARAALTRASPSVQARFDSILRDGAADLNRRHDPKCAIFDIDTLATWADCVRGSGYASSTPWHFDNLPLCGRITLRQLNLGEKPWCPNGQCASEAQVRFEAALRDPRTLPADQLEALAFVVHIVADLHQPLHAIDNGGDQGGNKVALTIQPGALPSDAPNQRNPQLHGLWDGALPFVAYGPARTGLAPLGVRANQLNGRSTATPNTWLLESQKAAQRAYRRLSPSPACGAVPLTTEAVSATYVRKQAKIARDRMALAVIRLGRILDADLTPSL